MKNSRIYSLAVAVVATMGMSSCQKQDDGPKPQTDMMNVKINTFIKEGDNIRPFSGRSRAAGVGTLDYGYYLYVTAHKTPFASTALAGHTKIVSMGQVKPGSGLGIPLYFFQNSENMKYSFQAVCTVGPDAKLLKAHINDLNTGTPATAYSTYVSAVINTLGKVDVLGAATVDVTVTSDEVPEINLYFEHRLSRVVYKLLRLNAGGPDLYDVKMSVAFSSGGGPTVDATVTWMPGTTVAPGSGRLTGSKDFDGSINIPSSTMTPVFFDDFIYPQQYLGQDWAVLSMTYALEPGSTNRFTIKTGLPALNLLAGKQHEVLIGHNVEADQLVVSGVSLKAWTTVDIDVPEYK